MTAYNSDCSALIASSTHYSALAAQERSHHLPVHQPLIHKRKLIVAHIIQLYLGREQHF